MNILAGWPVDEQKRAELRRIVNGPIPAVVPNSVQKICGGCGMLVWLGPLTAHSVGIPMCPWCMIKEIQQVAGKCESPMIAIPTQNLGNPDSKLEDE